MNSFEYERHRIRKSKGQGSKSMLSVSNKGQNVSDKHAVERYKMGNLQYEKGSYKNLNIIKQILFKTNFFKQ